MKLIVFVLFISACAEGAKILGFFPMASISHQVVFHKLTTELARRGHEVTTFNTDTAFPDGNVLYNITENVYHEESYKIWWDHMKTIKTTEAASIDLVMTLVEATQKIFRNMIKSDQFQKILKEKQQFDLIMVELFFAPALGLTHIFKAPLIQISSMSSVELYNQMLGIPSHPIFFPDSSLHRKTYDLTLLDKCINIKDYLITKYKMYCIEEKSNDLIKELFGSNAPTMSELMNNVDFVLLNVNEIFDDMRPLPPNVVRIGGLHQKEPKTIPTDLQANLDSSKHGVIYMSFGTNVNPLVLSQEKVQVFCKVFSRLPYDVIWKWNGDVLPGKPENVNISKWLPQSDLLRHPKIKLFITQGGLQSTDEAITAGVPLLAFPMLGDQWYNADKYVHHKIGIKMDFDTVTEEALEKSINTIIGDESYKKNIIRLNKIMKDQPQSPLERAVWWTEYVIRHGGAKHLRSPAANISWAEYLILDVVAVFLAALVLAILVLVFTLRFLFRLVCGSKKVKTQ